MCGIFGGLQLTSNHEIEFVKKLAKLAEQRGRDSSGLIICEQDKYRVVRADLPISNLSRK